MQLKNELEFKFYDKITRLTIQFHAVKVNLIIV